VDIVNSEAYCQFKRENIQPLYYARLEQLLENNAWKSVDLHFKPIKGLSTGWYPGNGFSELGLIATM